ncbi:hypothetical protein [Peribacillus glennii]|uniref:hypothetical protein n=1 Tax=Peribacillus glennii TaxID=2303991 RepID=UPI00115D7923|nr:hypothetical protein [Peribacillus glennii]
MDIIGKIKCIVSWNIFNFNYNLRDMVFDESAFSDPVIIFFSVILPLTRLTAVLLSKKGAIKIVGFVVNLVVLLFSVILPAASTLFWNQPYSNTVSA